MLVKYFKMLQSYQMNNDVNDEQNILTDIINTYQQITI